MLAAAKYLAHGLCYSVAAESNPDFFDCLKNHAVLYSPPFSQGKGSP